MWIKSEADRKLYNLEFAHTIEVLKKSQKYYVVALFQGSSVNGHFALGELHVAQLTGPKTEEDAHLMLSKITRQMGNDAFNMDTAESRKKQSGSGGLPGGGPAPESEPQEPDAPPAEA